MKSRLFFIAVLLSLVSFGQNAKDFTVSIQKQSVVASPDQDNTAKQLTVHANIRSVEQLKILNGRWQDEKTFKRSFRIYDSADKEILIIPASNQSSYHVSIKQLRSVLNKNRTYFLYSSGVPKDPAVAATVRVRRVLVCKINVK